MRCRTTASDIGTKYNSANFFGSVYKYRGNLNQHLNGFIVDDEGVITTFNLADGAGTNYPVCG